MLRNFRSCQETFQRVPVIRRMQLRAMKCTNLSELEAVSNL